MQVSLTDLTAVATIILSILILGVSAWNLYLSHYRETRSEVNVLAEESSNSPRFSGGSHAIGEDAHWTTNFYLKVTNTGEKSAYIKEVTHSLKGLRKNGDLNTSSGAEIDTRSSSRNWNGKELKPHSSTRYRASLSIAPEEDIGVFIEHDSAVIEHTFTAEDNKGSYKESHETDVLLTGPDGAIENWQEHQEG